MKAAVSEAEFKDYVQRHCIENKCCRPNPGEVKRLGEYVPIKFKRPTQPAAAAKKKKGKGKQLNKRRGKQKRSGGKP
jgi:hypothetical protein